MIRNILNINVLEIKKDVIFSLFPALSPDSAARAAAGYAAA